RFSLSDRRCPMDRLTVSLLCLVMAAIPEGRAQEALGTALPEGAIARIGSLQLRHQSTLHQLAFLPNGFLAALDTNGWLRLWDTSTGHERRNFIVPSKQGESGRAYTPRLELIMRGQFGGGLGGGIRWREADTGPPPPPE